MLPMLKFAADSQEHSVSATVDALALHFNLSDAEKREMLPSGAQAVFTNRVGWASTYLKKAGLLESSGRGKFRITSRGLEVLKENPAILNATYLKRFPEFNEFRTQAKSAETLESTAAVATEPQQTPQEILDSTAEELRRTLAQELIDQIKSCTPQFFEKLVVTLLCYGLWRVSPGRGRGRRTERRWWCRWNHQRGQIRIGRRLYSG